MQADRTELPQNLRAALRDLVQVFARFQVRYALIGALAAGYRSRPRFTQDLDFLVDIPQVVLPGLLEALAERGFRFDRNTVIREWTQDHLTSLDYHGVRIDWLKPVLPCLRHALEGASAEAWPDATIPVATAEALILLKLLSFRTQDQADIENLLAANSGQLNLDWVRREWETLGLPDDGRRQRFEDMVARLHAPP